MHRTTADLLAGLPDVERSPVDLGTLELIVRRPAPGQRDVPASAELSVEHGLVGDSWLARGSRHTEDGAAVVEVTAAPHTGCAKFADRFGMDAARFVNSADGARLRLRGINARVVLPGTIRCGDEVRRARS